VQTKLVKNAKKTATFQANFSEWLSKHRMTAKQAAPKFGCSVATAYSYADGTSLPAAPRIPALAKVLKIDEAMLRKIVAADRCRQAKQMCDKETT
jgi:hypothetical protein